VVHAAKRRGRTRARILYWFRTPPGVRVGRAALDEEAIRLIEEHNPEVDFDWTRILKGQEAPEPRTRPGPERRAGRSSRSRDAAAPSPALPVAAPSADARSPAAPRVPQPIVEADEPGIPMTLGPDEPASAALTRLGPEGLLRLRARHAEVLARISEKIADPARLDELKSQAERLNPDTWVTDGDVTSGLEQYESVFESLRSVVGRRRTRRRRRSRGGEAPGGAEAVAVNERAGEAPNDGVADSADEPDEPDGTV